MAEGFHILVVESNPQGLQPCARTVPASGPAPMDSSINAAEPSMSKANRAGGRPYRFTFPPTRMRGHRNRRYPIRGVG
jgi:hypothetical protein